MNTRELTGGRDRDKGWTQTVPTTLWTPSVHDRRRIAVAEMQMAAEAKAPVTFLDILTKHSAGEVDLGSLISNFEGWMHKQQH